MSYALVPGNSGIPSPYTQGANLFTNNALQPPPSYNLNTGFGGGTSMPMPTSYGFGPRNAAGGFNATIPNPAYMLSPDYKNLLQNFANAGNTQFGAQPVNPLLPGPGGGPPGSPGINPLAYSVGHQQWSGGQGALSPPELDVTNRNAWGQQWLQDATPQWGQQAHSPNFYGNTNWNNKFVDTGGNAFLGALSNPGFGFVAGLGGALLGPTLAGLGGIDGGFGGNALPGFTASQVGSGAASGLGSGLLSLGSKIANGIPSVSNFLPSSLQSLTGPISSFFPGPGSLFPNKKQQG